MPRLRRRLSSHSSPCSGAVQEKDRHWYYLRGKAYEWTEDYQKAVGCYHQAEDGSKEVYAALERCYSHLEDYKKAYEYACKQR